MSLDVYLRHIECTPVSEAKIYIREDGQNKTITREEWDEKFPDRKPVVVTSEDEVFTYNITHNLNRMAMDAGLYEALWRPDENSITKAAQLIEPLEKGLALLRAEPERFKVFNPSNGWGNYEGLVKFVAEYLSACRIYPEAEVEVSR